MTSKLDRTKLTEWQMLFLQHLVRRSIDTGDLITPQNRDTVARLLTKLENATTVVVTGVNLEKAAK